MDTPPHTDNRLIENVAAISGEMHSSTDLYRPFYLRHCDALGGFPGVWNYVARAGEIFSEVEAGEPPDIWDNGNWVDVIIDYATFILHAETLPTEVQLRLKAIELIRTRQLEDRSTDGL